MQKKFPIIFRPLLGRFFIAFLSHQTTSSLSFFSHERALIEPRRTTSSRWSIDRKGHHHPR
jgi:hypothetical protein